MIKAIVLVMLLLAAVSPARGLAQDQDYEVVDRVAAVVGGRPILLSKVEEMVNVARAMGQEVPEDSVGRAQLIRRLLEDLVNDELIVQAAQQDTSIEVTNQEVQAQVEEQLKQIRQQFASDFEFDRQLRVAGFGTLEEYRRWLHEQKRREMIKNQFLQQLRQKGVIAPIQPTEREMRQFYEENKSRMQKRPAAVSFRHIAIRPKPDSAAVARARQRVDSIVNELRRGADFAAAARRFSDDPGTKDYGGDLGWFRRGSGYAREFEAAAFQLRPGQISDPVRTVFGFHIIQVQRVEPAEVQARHILVAPELTDEDRAQAAALADTVAARLRQGASFDSLARLHSDPAEETLFESVPRTQLPPEYAAALEGAQPGDVVGPFPYEGVPGQVKQIVLAFQEALPEGEYTFAETRDQIRSRLAEESVLKRYVERLRGQTYVDIRL